MLVPKFALQQTEEEVVVTIKVPYIRVGEAEVSVDGQDFAFYCKPYLLKLHFPRELRNNEEDESHCRAVYDAHLDHGTMTLHIKKKEKGQLFEDLDLTTTLLQPVRSFAPAGIATETGVGEGAATAEGGGGGGGPPSIEVLNSEEYIPNSTSAASAQEETQTNTHTHIPTTTHPRYGFNRQYHGVFTHLTGEMMVLEVLRLPDPEHTPEETRWLLREAEEEADFDAERYLGDLCGGEEDPIYQEAMAMRPFWMEEEGGEGGGGGGENVSTFDEVEKEEMSLLKNKEFLIEPGETKALGLCLLDVLLAFIYDYRTTGGEPTVESAWTITTLSPALSYLETYHFYPPPSSSASPAVAENEIAPSSSSTSSSPLAPSVKDVTRAFLRRSLTYPYLRSWSLAQRCLKDAHHILTHAHTQGAKRMLLRCFLRARRVLRRTETHYLLLRIFIDDMCVFLQQSNGGVVERVLEEMVGEMKRKKKKEEGGGWVWGCEKAEVGLGLEEVERRLCMEESSEEESESESESESEEEESECETEGESESEHDSEEEEEEETDESESECEEEREEATLVTALGEVSLFEKKREKEEEEEEEEGGGEEGLLVGLGKLSMQEPQRKREKLDVTTLAGTSAAISSLYVGGMPREEGEGADKKHTPTTTTRPLIEEI